MRRIASRITAILIASVMALSLCSCGGGESGSAEGTGSTVETEAAQPSQQEESASKAEEEAGLLLLEVNGQTLEADLEDNEAARALKDLIGEDGLELELEEYGGFEKVGPLPEALPASDEQMDTSAGDIVLYQGDQISLFYGENSWSYTRLGRVRDADGTRLQEILGDGDVSVVLKLEE